MDGKEFGISYHLGAELRKLAGADEVAPIERLLVHHGSAEDVAIAMRVAEQHGGQITRNDIPELVMLGGEAVRLEGLPLEHAGGVTPSSRGRVLPMEPFEYARTKRMVQGLEGKLGSIEDPLVRRRVERLLEAARSLCEFYEEQKSRPGEHS